MQRQAASSLNRSTVGQRFAIVLIFVGLIGMGYRICRAQDEQAQRNFNPGIPYSISDVENINLTNGTLMLNFDFGDVKGRGSAATEFSLKYNSKLYEPVINTALDDSGQDATQSFLQQSNEGGWMYDQQYRIGVVGRSDGDQTIDYGGGCIPPNFKAVFSWRVTVYFPDGSQHEFMPTGYLDHFDDGFFNVDTSGNITNLSFSVDSSASCPSGTIYSVVVGDTHDPNPKMTYYSTDGTYMRLEIPNGQNPRFPSAFTIYMPDGSKVVSDTNTPNSGIEQKIYDKNGNYVTDGAVTLPDGTTAGGKVDEFGRYVALKPNFLPNEDRIYRLGPDGQLLTWKIKWKFITISRQYKTSGVSGGRTRGGSSTQVLRSQPKVVDEIDLPDQLGGQKYTFTYNALDGQVPWDPQNPVYSPGWGEIIGISLPSGARTEYDVDTGVLPQMDTDLMLPRLGKVSAKRLIYDEQYDGVTTQKTDTWGYNSNQTGGAVEIGPDGGVSTQSFYSTATRNPLSGRVFAETRPDGTTVERIWRNNTVNSCSAVGCVSMTANPFVKTEFTTIRDHAGTPSLTSIKDYDYDKNGNVTGVREYDWVPYSSIPVDSAGHPMIPSGVQPKRITENVYANPTEDSSNTTANNGLSYWNSGSYNVRNAVISTTIKNGLGVPVARSEYSYFDVNSTANLTGTTVWDSFKDGQYRAYSAPLSGPNSQSTTIVYDGYGNPTLVTDPKGAQTQMTYGNVTGPSGPVTDLYPTQTVKAYGTAVARTSTATYDFYTGLTTSATDVDNSVTNATEYDALGRPTKSITAQGTAVESWTTSEYHDADRYVVVRSDLETKGDGKKVATQFYDQLGRVRLSKTLEDASVQSATNETDGIKVETRYLTDYNSGTGVGHTYQLSSNPFRAATSSAASTEPTMGWTLSTALNTGRHSEVQTFSGAGLPTVFGGSNTSSTGIVTTDSDADRILVTDQAGKRRISRSNALGQLTDVWEVTPSDGSTVAVTFPNTSIATGYQTTYAYDTLNNLTTVNQGSQTRTFTYSSLSRLLSAANPESGTISYTYDNDGNLATKTDARSITTTYAYDALNRVTSRSYNDSPQTPTVSYTYDDKTHAKGKLTKVSSSVSTTEYTSFDILGRVTGHKQTTDGTDYTTGYTYNLSGALDTETYPSTRVVKNELNNDGTLSMVESKKDATHGYWVYANSFTYNPTGAVTSMQLGNGKWESTTFNSRLQPTQIALGTTNTGALAYDLLKLNYDYGTTANNGNVQTQTITVPGMTYPLIQNYAYDSLNRIASATETSNSSQTWKQAFTYDRYGNRNFNESQTTMPASFSNPTVSDPTISSTNNRFASGQGYSYDAAGNTTADAGGQTYVYDAENKMVSASNGSSTLGQYFYDGDGKRVKKYVPSTGETTVFVYDAGGKSVAEYSILVASVQDAKVNYLTADHLGSPRINTDQNGAVISRHDYHPFGEEIDGSGGRTIALNYGDDSVRKQFTGYERDKETDLNLAQTRYQQASTGRFTTPDIYLIIFEMKRGRDASEQLEMLQKYLAEPRNLNRYIYALDNPYKYTDPTGMRPPTDIERAALGKLDELIRAAKVAEKQDLAAGLAKAKTEISDIIARLGKNEAAPRGVGIAVFAILNVGNGDYSNRASIRGSNGVVIGSGQFKCNVFVAEAYIQGGHIGDFPNANGGAYPLANILGDANKETVGNLAIAWDLGGPAIGDIIAWKANDGPMGHSSIYIGGGVLAYAGGVPDGTPKVETMKYVDDSMRRPSQGWFGSQGPPEHQPGIIRRYNGKP